MHHDIDQARSTNIGSANHGNRLANLHRKSNLSPDQEIERSKEQTSPTSSTNFRFVLSFCLSIVVLVGLVGLIIRYAGAQYSLAGYTHNTNERQVIIHSNVITAPANMIRYPSQRRLVEADRLDLYLHWPTLEGYSEKLEPAFNDVDNSSAIIFISLTPRFNAYDMSQRVGLIYHNFFVDNGQDQKNGLVSYALDPEAGFLDEHLLVEKTQGELGKFAANAPIPAPYAARCLDKKGNRTTPYCLRDFNIGNNLSLTYRFHRDLSDDWREMEQSIQVKFAGMIK